MSSRSLVLQNLRLSKGTMALIQIPTPPQFVKTREGKGHKTFRYVEGGYVVARLNEIFSPVGWDFEVLEHIIEPKEVVVKGRLTLKTPKDNFQISKTQYGSKERYPGSVPLGDTLKAAATDCLKKCASLIGIGLDIMWTQLDQPQENKNKQEAVVIQTPKETKAQQDAEKQKLMRTALKWIEKENNPTVLTQFKDRIAAAPHYSRIEKTTLFNKIDIKLQKYVKKTEKDIQTEEADWLDQEVKKIIK